jgi:cytochrome bd-type quinol oxidase subunit 2
MRAVYRYLSLLVFAAVVVQVGFAGYGAFAVAHDIDDNGSVDEDMFTEGFGYLLILLGLILLIVALVARHRSKHSAILFGLLVLQFVLALAGYGMAALGFLHPVNALVIFALSGWIAMGEWRSRSAIATV